MQHVLALLLAAPCAAIIATGVVGTLAGEQDGPATDTVNIVVQAHPAPKAGENCLSDADLREAVAENRVIAPIAAIRAARAALPRAEIQRATLCKREQGLVYLMTTLSRDGHFIQVAVDAKSGRVSGP